MGTGQSCTMVRWIGVGAQVCDNHQLYLRAVIRDESGEEYGLMRRLFQRIQTSGGTMTGTIVSDLDGM